MRRPIVDARLRDDERQRRSRSSCSAPRSSLFVWDRLPVGDRRHRRRALAVGDRRARRSSRRSPASATRRSSSSRRCSSSAKALDATGVTAWAGQQLVARAGESRTRLIVLTMLLVAVLTALISVNGAVAALVPVAVVMAVRLGRSPSQLLLPLAFGAHAGSLLALTGTPVNVIVSDAAADAGVGRFGFFEFALVGVPLVAGTIAIVVLFGERLLPHRAAALDRARLQRPRAHAGRAVRARRTPPDALLTRTLGRRRGGDPAALGAGRRDGVPRHGHRQRRPRRPRACSARARTLAGRDRARRSATRCCCRAPGRARPAPRRPDVLVVDPPELVRRQAVPLGHRRQAGDRGARRRWSSCSPPARSRPRSPACSPPARSSCSAC